MPPRGEAAALRRRVHSQPVAVAAVDWSDLLAGVKTEFRGLKLSIVYAPRPALLYSFHPLTDELRTHLAILEETWQEPLGAISGESLAREGFESIGDFRRYWIHRYPQWGFRSLQKVQVYRLRMWTADDAGPWGEWLLRQLYLDAF